MRGGRGLRRSEPSGFPAGRPFGRTVVRRKRAGVPFRTVPGRPLPVAALVRPLRLPLLIFCEKKLYGRINFSAFHEVRRRVFAIFASNPDERRPPCCCTAFSSGSGMPLPACPSPASRCCSPGSGAGGRVRWRCGALPAVRRAGEALPPPRPLRDRRAGPCQTEIQMTGDKSYLE